jgi:hypothetical protein
MITPARMCMLPVIAKCPRLGLVDRAAYGLDRLYRSDAECAPGACWMYAIPTIAATYG